MNDDRGAGLEQRLAMKAFGLVLLLASAVAVAVGFWLLVRFAVEPEPYRDPETLGPSTYALRRILGP